jgi:hypothetical protein
MQDFSSEVAPTSSVDDLAIRLEKDCPRKIDQESLDQESLDQEGFDQE